MRDKGVAFVKKGENGVGVGLQSPVTPGNGPNSWLARITAGPVGQDAILSHFIPELVRANKSCNLCS